MIKFLIFSVISIAALSSTVAIAQQSPLLQPFGPTVKIIGTPEPGANLGISGPANVPPRWSLAQWSIPKNLAPAVNAPASGWTTANGYGRVVFSPTQDGFTNVYELAQAGNVCGVERDMFLGAGSDDLQGLQASAPLSEVGSLFASITLQPQYFSTSKDCQNQYGQYVYSFILSSTGGNGYQPQTWFYQVNVGRNAPFEKQANPGWCPGYDDRATQEFCADDDVRNLNTGHIVFGQKGGVVDFELLPRLKAIIQSNHRKVGAGSSVRLDPELSHWRITSIYLGEILQGKTISTTRWSNPKLDQYKGGTFCSKNKTVQFICNVERPPNNWGWDRQADGCWHRTTMEACR